MKTTNRREFLKNATIGSTAAGIGLTASGILPRKIYSQEKTGSHNLAYRNLGSTGYKVTEIGFGAMNTRDAELITAAIDSGINYLDTAYSYMNGVNEEIIGTIMKTKRNKVFLTTKMPAQNPSEIPSMLETSLKRLQTDHVDLLLLHNISGADQLLNEDFMKSFDNAKKQGKTRFVGFSTHEFPAVTADASLKNKFWEAVLVVYNYLSPQEVTDSIKKVHESGLAVIAMKTMLSVQRPRQPLGDIREDKTSKVTPKQALLKWVFNNPNVDTIIPGMTAFEHLDEDLGVMGMKLTSDDRSILRHYSENLKGSYCLGINGCTGCEDKCPKGVAVKEINRCIGYAYGYGDVRLAKENYWNLPDSNRIDVCSDCDECVVKCVNGINLTENIRDARKLFA